jgi:hypothetical protein
MPNDPRNKFNRPNANTVLVAEDAPVTSATKFLKRTDARNAQHAKPVTVDAPKKTTSGNRLTPELERLRREAYAKAEAPRDMLPEATDVLTKWLEETPEGQALTKSFRAAVPGKPEYDYTAKKLTDNLVSIGNILEEQMLRYGTKPSLSLVGSCYVYARDHNHFFPTYKFDPSTGGIIKPMGSYSNVEPTIYPPYESPEAKAARNAEDRQTEEARLRKLPLEELRKLAKKDHKFPKPGHPGNSGGWR